MISMLRTTVMCTCVILCALHAAFADSPYTGPDDPQAMLAAEEAVTHLGQGGGALSIGYKAVDITGLSAAIAAKTINVEETLKALNAEQVGTEIRLSLSGDVLFDFDKWDIKPGAGATLDKIAGIVEKLKKTHMLIEGHTDAKGSAAYNLSLSQKRAEAVRQWFLENSSLKQVAFTTRGYGESRPVAANILPDGSDNPEGRAKNRRVEIKITP